MSRLEDIIGGSLPLIKGSVYQFRPVQPAIHCQDGTTLSVQASSMHYATPRDDVGPYSHVEVGYPSVVPPSTWAPYNTGDEDQHAIYSYVPVALVHEYVAAHGGEGQP